LLINGALSGFIHLIERVSLLLKAVSSWKIKKIGKPEFIRKPNKRHAASSANFAQSHEMIYEEGGEVGFIKKMIDESIIIGKRIKYFLKIYTI